MNEINAAGFRRNGYVVVPNLFSMDERSDCLQEIAAVFNAMAERFNLAPTRSPDMAALSPLLTSLFAENMAAYLAAAKLAQHTVALHRMGCGKSLMLALQGLGLGQPVLSTRPVLFLMADALKVPGGYHKTPPHQDWRSIQGSLDSVVVWTPFSPAGPNNYPLEILPGSHRLGLLPSLEDAFGHRVAEDLSNMPFLALDVAPGDAVIMSQLLVHRTGERGGSGVRAAASFRFNNITEPSFIARNYPNPYIYKADMRLLDESAATPESVAKVFGES